MNKNFIMMLLLLAMSPAFAQSYTLDTTFGDGGTLQCNATELQLYNIAVQPDGKFIAIGRTYLGNYIARFNENGIPDATFGTDGIITAPIPMNTVQAVKVLPDGKIFVAGSLPFKVMKLNSNGTRDTSFGSNGIATLEVGPERSRSWNMDVQPDGKIIICGTTWMEWFGISGADQDMAVVRLNTDGTPDTTFNGSGIVTYTDPDTIDYAFTVKVDNEGKIVAGGTLGLLHKYNADGTPDINFGIGGTLTIFGDGEKVTIFNCQIMPDNKIMVAGSMQGTGKAYIARLNPNGTFDPSFGNGGVYIPDFDDGNGGASEIAVHPDGTYTVLGYKNSPGIPVRSFILKLGSNGLPESTLAGSTTHLSDSTGSMTPSGVAMLPDGKVLAAVTVFNTSYDGQLRRYNVSGALGGPSYEKPQIAVYPNPSTDKVTVTGLPEETMVFLFNISGQKVLEVTVNGDTPIDISGLARGLYFLDTDRGSAKIIKQ